MAEKYNLWTIFLFLQITVNTFFKNKKNIKKLLDPIYIPTTAMVKALKTQQKMELHSFVFESIKTYSWVFIQSFVICKLIFAIYWSSIKLKEACIGLLLFLYIFYKNKIENK